MLKVPPRTGFAIAAFLLALVAVQAPAADYDLQENWPTLGNNPNHTGYQPVYLRGAFSPGWTVFLGTDLTAISQVAISNGVVFATPTYDDTGVTALDATTGAELWRKSILPKGSMTAPTVNAGKVYVHKNNGRYDTQLHCLNAADGTTAWVAPIEEQVIRHLAPTATDTGVWVQSGYYGGLQGFNPSNGSLRFFNSTLESSQLWTPAYYNGVIYTWLAGSFRAHDPMTGVVLWSVKVSNPSASADMKTVPAIDAGRAFLIDGSNTPLTSLFAVDLTTHVVSWTVAGKFKGIPATANGKVYAILEGNVNAYDAQTGALLGTYAAADTALSGQPIVTRDALIVASSTKTYIFNLDTFSSIQTLSFGGMLSLANGVLYVANQSDGGLRTFVSGMYSASVTASASVNEGSGPQTGTVTLSAVSATDTVLSLFSNNPGRLTVPGTVTIPANQTSANFQFSVVDDGVINGDQSIKIIARSAASAYRTGFAVVTVRDNESATLSLAAPPSVVEGETRQLTVSMGGVAAEDITVTLASSDTTEIMVPASVVIPAGQSSATFKSYILNEGVLDGAQSVTLTASVQNWTSGVATISVLDSGLDAQLDWPTYGNGPAHTGYQPVTLGSSPFEASWMKTLAPSDLNPVAIKDGMIFATFDSGVNPYAVALDAVTGVELWRRMFTDANSIGAPTVSGGKLFTQRCDNTPDSQLWCLNAGGGSVAWSVPYAAQWDTYYAPPVADGSVWMAGGTYGGVYGLNVSDGSQRFAEFYPNGFDEWTPAYYNGMVYTWVEGVFRAHDSQTGALQWARILDWQWTGWSMNTAPTVDDGWAYVIGSSNLYAFDLATHEVGWVVTGAFLESPVTANGVVYVRTGSVIEAYQRKTGQFLGTYAPPIGNTGTPLITNDSLIVSSPSNTYIFDLQTFALRQTLSGGGVPSLANGVLYLAGADGVLRTYRQPGRNPITINLASSSAAETSAPVAGSVVLFTPAVGDTVVTLAVVGSGRVTVPTSVTVLAGQTSASFQVTLVDDALLNGSETVSITARGPAPVFLSSAKSFRVDDNEAPSIAVTIPASAAESAGNLSGTVTLSIAPVADLTVTLLSSDSAQATVPASVKVLAGQKTATFTLAVVNDTFVDGTQTVGISASATGWNAGTGFIQISDNESRAISLAALSTISEGGTVTGTVSVVGKVLVDLVISLSSSNSTQFSVPASVTIPAGQSSATFIGTGIDDTTTDGTQTSTVMASAATFTNATRTATVTDNDVHHFLIDPITGVLQAGINRNVSMSAKDVNNVTITSFNSAVDLSAAGDGGDVPFSSETRWIFSSGLRVATIALDKVDTNVRLTATWEGVTGTSNAFNVVPAANLVITPAEDFSATGPVGGPFTPASRVYTLTNTGAVSLNWKALKTTTWLTLSLGTGTLAPGATVDVTASLSAASLQTGTYTDSIAFTNLTTNLGNTQRAVSLVVTLPAPVIAAEPAATGGTGNTLSWSTVAAATSYEIQASMDAAFSSPTSSGWITGTSYLFAGLTNGVEYRFRVRARNGTAPDSGWSTVVSSRQDASAPVISVTTPQMTTQPNQVLAGLGSDFAGFASFTINGTPATSADGFAHWNSAALNLVPGWNVLNLVATDAAVPPNTLNRTHSIYLATAQSDADSDGLPDAWETQYGLDPFQAEGSAGAAGDFDHDGLTNFLERALGLNPTKADTAGGTAMGVQTDQTDGLRYATFSYRRLLAPGSLVYVVEATRDLRTWSSEGLELEQVGSPVPTGDGLTETVVVRVRPSMDTPGYSLQYMRLRVTTGP